MRIRPSLALLALLPMAAGAFASGAPRTQAAKGTATAEIEELKRNVRQRCGARGEKTEALLPWYYHYVVGEELHRKGHDAEALDYIKTALAKRPDPKAGARVYGVWFIDYLPYSLIADVNDRLGHPDCAADARVLARTLEPRSKK